jgi:hypothetical protein
MGGQGVRYLPQNVYYSHLIPVSTVSTSDLFDIFGRKLTIINYRTEKAKTEKISAYSKGFLEHAKINYRVPTSNPN